MKKLDTSVRGLLLNEGSREAGSAVIDGKEVSWDAGYVLTILPFDDRRGQARKYVVDPQIAKSVEAELEEVSWGALVQLQTRGKFVVTVDVLLDWGDSIVQ